MKKQGLALAVAAGCCLMLAAPVLGLASASVLAPNGQLIELDAARLEGIFGLEPGRLSGVTVTELPEASQGVLTCEGVVVESYDYLPREALDWLVFEPYQDDGAARVGLLPDAGQAAHTVISLVSADQPDTVQISLPVETAALQGIQNGYWGHLFDACDVLAAP